MSVHPVSLKAEAVNKSFAANQVLYDVSLELKSGSIHALVGENGAGKSTLMKIFAGIHDYDSGEITLSGKKLELGSPKKAQNSGIMLMHQELSLFPEMTVAENIFSGHLPSHSRIFLDKNFYAKANDILTQLQYDFKAEEYVKNLSVANQHLCEFARFLSMEPSFIILDEPTASLTEHEKELLFKAIRKLCNEHNLGVLYISHRMHEIFEIADTVSVLRDGVMQGTFPLKEIDEEQLTRLMIGRNLEQVHRQAVSEHSEKREVLEVKNLSSSGLFEDINFKVYSGEVLGMAGLIGARCKDIADAIFGLNKASKGEIIFKDQKLNSYTVKQAIKRGMALVPDERKEQGLVLGMSCVENMTLASLIKMRSRGFLSRYKEKIAYEHYQKLLAIKASGAAQTVSELSGGNQQKIILAKWLLSEPSLFILNEPTRGVDVGAKAEIYRLIQNLVQEGYAVLLLSSDMHELLTLSTRVIAIHNGKLISELTSEQINEDAVIKAISGIREEVDAC